MVARRVAAIRATHYHRETAPLSLADCICLATALQLGTDLATADPALAAVARALGIEVRAVPDSNGVAPSSGSDAIGVTPSLTSPAEGAFVAAGDVGNDHQAAFVVDPMDDAPGRSVDPDADPPEITTCGSLTAPRGRGSPRSARIAPPSASRAR